MTSRRRSSAGPSPGRRFAILALAVLSLLLLSCGGADKPNIILITLDTTRADRIGCYGSGVASTPVLDGLATESILFEIAVTSVPITLPAHASILTGLTPLGHGVHNNGSFRLDPAFYTLAEYLGYEGYETGAFVSAFVLDHRFGLDQGFDVYDDRLDNERRAAATTARAVRWLEDRTDQPFFLWVHYFDPHTPWEAPEPFASATRGTGYDAEISAMDASLGRLLDAVRARGLYDGAHVIVIGDHGEGLQDHGEEEHGVFLYDETLRVPFLWKTPGMTGPRRVGDLVGVIDVLPTVLDLVGEPIPKEIEGRSLAAVIEGGGLERDGLFAETLYPFYAYEWSPLHAWRTTEWKYVDAPTPELYDLRTDPGEVRNVLTDHTEVASTLGTQLETYREAVARTLAIPTEGVVGADVQERLRSLGYIAGGGRESTSDPEALPDPKDYVTYLGHFETGKRAMDDQNWAVAREEFGAVLAELPDPPIATLGMGLAELGLGHPAEAEHWLRKTIAAQPDNPFATIGMAQALLARGQPGEAIPWFEHYLTMKPGDPAAAEGMGDAFAALGRHDEALAQYERAAGTRPSALMKTAETLLRLDRVDEAVARYEEGARRSSPNARPVWIGRAARARRLSSVGILRPASSATDFSAQIITVASLGLHEDARHLLERGRVVHEPMVVAVAEGDLALQSRDWEAAASAYARAEELGSRAPEVYQNHFVAYVQMGKIDDTEALLTRGTSVTDDAGGTLHYNLACVLSRKGRVEQALDALDGAIDRGYSDLRNLNEDSDLESVRDHSRFALIVAKVQP